MSFLENEIRLRRIAMVIRWIAIAWIVLAYALPPLVSPGRTNWEDYFDDAFLIGVLPGALALLLSYGFERLARDHGRRAT
jgi:hypothetical protein